MTTPRTHRQMSSSPFSFRPTTGKLCQWETASAPPTPGARPLSTVGASRALWALSTPQASRSRCCVLHSSCKSPHCLQTLPTDPPVEKPCAGLSTSSHRTCPSRKPLPRRTARAQCFLCRERVSAAFGRLQLSRTHPTHQRQLPHGAPGSLRGRRGQQGLPDVLDLGSLLSLSAC